MQKIAPQYDLNQLFPVLEINDECIISKSGDITIAYELQQPPRHSLEVERYNDLRNLFSRAYQTLPIGTIILKQDIYFKRKYIHSGGNETFLLKKYSEHFNGREYLDYKSILYFCLPTKVRQNVKCKESILSSRHILFGKTSPEKIVSFRQSVEQAIAIICSDSSLIGASRLNAQDCNTLISHIMNFSFDEETLVNDMQAKSGAYIVGNRKIFNLALSSLDDMPDSYEENVKDYDLSTDNTSLYGSVLSQIGYTIPVNHIVNQYIKIIDSRKAESKMATNAQFMLSFSSISAENTANHENIIAYLKDNPGQQNRTIKYSVQVLVEGEDDINSIVAIMLRHGIRFRHNTYNASIPLWASIPGNSADLPQGEYMTTSMDVAVGMTALEGASKSIVAGTFWITDRITNTPVNIDFSAAAMAAGFITNYNIFTLGPSGSGKSFITNELIMQSYYRDKAHCVIIDKGDSYLPLCKIINEETGGADGIYFNGEEYPFSFNPFIGVQADDVNAVAFLTSLLLCIWGEKDLSQAISTKLTDAVIQYLKSDYHRSLNGFYDFFFNDYLTEHWIKLKKIKFSVDEFETNLSLFTRKGIYKNLLNAESDTDLADKRFVMFEIDSISNNDRIFPLVTLLITKVFADKMRVVPGKKIMLIEEAWKAILSPHMESWIHWLWKTARKHNAQAIVVTQELDDLIASSVIKESIIANSDTKILLDQRTSKNNYDTIANYLSLGEHDRNMIFSINRHNNPKYKYKEAYISIGGYKHVYALETSPYAYWVYTTEPKEKQRRKEEVERTGSYIQAITNLVNGTL